MTEPNTLYSVKRPLPAHSRIIPTPAEENILKWIRRNSGNGKDWTGTIRYVSGASVYQMSDHINAGQIIEER